ncbi:MAG: macrolide ABC transporter ATP-binding protein [Euryarchaeota archaeon RBG_19FT_COMBO_56_21]|nr:MAG: macrolide ABC transporter ATP-binding protein [Euryarchaeota archaeon RBG_19FT_COMBO_56_21]
MSREKASGGLEKASAPAKGAIVAKQVVKTYDTGKVKVEALRGVDLSVKEGDMIAIMGPSGCGKTTLLNCLSGLDDLSGGEIYINGKPLSGMNDRERTRYRAEKIGFIFQAYNLLPVLTSAENVELPLLLAGKNPKEARKLALEALRSVGLEEWSAHKPSELSGGQQQRVTIARSFVNRPEIVFGDEPTGNLDSESSKDIMGLLKKLNKENKQTFIIVTHDYTVGRMADKIVMMKDGLIEKEFVPAPY